MNFKLKLTNNTTYAEVGQNNPLRWKTLFRETEQEFSDQSGWIKCKDFYNDTVAYFKSGVEFSIWSYQNKVKKNDEGVYFLLKYIRDKKSFFHDIEILNQRLQADLNCKLEVWDHENDEVVVLIPNPLWESTYRISMVTMCIRLCNYGVAYHSWEDFWSTSAPSQTMERAFTPDALENARKMGFTVPEKFKKYWWFAGMSHNSEATPNAKGSIIHDNGVSTWSMWMKKA